MDSATAPEGKDAASARRAQARRAPRLRPPDRRPRAVARRRARWRYVRDQVGVDRARSVGVARVAAVRQRPAAERREASRAGRGRPARAKCFLTRGRCHRRDHARLRRGRRRGLEMAQRGATTVMAETRRSREREPQRGAGGAPTAGSARRERAVGTGVGLHRCGARAPARGRARGRDDTAAAWSPAARVRDNHRSDGFRHFADLVFRGGRALIIAGGRKRRKGVMAHVNDARRARGRRWPERDAREQRLVDRRAPRPSRWTTTWSAQREIVDHRRGRRDLRLHQRGGTASATGPEPRGGASSLDGATRRWTASSSSASPAAREPEPERGARARARAEAATEPAAEPEGADSRIRRGGERRASKRVGGGAATAPAVPVAAKIRARAPVHERERGARDEASQIIRQEGARARLFGAAHPGCSEARAARVERPEEPFSDFVNVIRKWTPQSARARGGAARRRRDRWARLVHESAASSRRCRAGVRLLRQGASSRGSS